MERVAMKIVVCFAVLLVIILLGGCAGNNAPITPPNDIPYPDDSILNDAGDTADPGAARFNFLTGDNELLRGGNITRAEMNWIDPVSAQPGDIINVCVYLHNGNVDTLAVNTIVRVTLPADTAGRITATIAASNSPLSTDTFVNGAMVGPWGLTVNTPSPAMLEYIPGSTQMHKPGKAVIQMPDAICGPDGLRVGNVAGCWEYARYITFQVRVG